MGRGLETERGCARAVWKPRAAKQCNLVGITDHRYRTRHDSLTSCRCGLVTLHMQAHHVKQ